jgi:hypothetical protein
MRNLIGVMAALSAIFCFATPIPATAECKFIYFGNSTEDKMDAARRHGACAAQEYIERHRKALQIDREAGFTMETAEMCGLSTVMLERLQSHYEDVRSLNSYERAEFNVAITQGRRDRRTNSSRLTVNNCVGIGRALSYYENLFRAAAQ